MKRASALARAKNNANEHAGLTPALLREVLASLGGAWTKFDNFDISAVELLYADILGSPRGRSLAAAAANQSEMSTDSEEENGECSVEELNEWLGAATDSHCTLALRTGALIGTWLAFLANEAARPLVLTIIEAIHRVSGPAFLRLILNAQGVPPTHVAAASADMRALRAAFKQHSNLASITDTNDYNLLHAIFEPLPGTRLQDSIATDMVSKAVELGAAVNVPALVTGSTALHLLAALESENAPNDVGNAGMAELLLSNSASPGCADANGFFPLHVAARAGPQAASVVDTLINQMKSSYAALEDIGVDGAEVLSSLSPALTPRGESAVDFALAPGGLFDLVSTNNSPASRSSQHLFLTAAHFIEAAAQIVTRGSQHPSSCPALGAAEGYTAAQRDALQRAQARSSLSFSPLENDWFALDEVGITSGCLPAIVAAMALQSPAAHSLSLRDNNLTGLFGTARRLASTWMGSWPNTSEDALSRGREEANLFASTSHLSGFSQLDVLRNLWHLDLSDNLSLNQLPTDLGVVIPNLETLILSGCGFDHLPQCVSQMNSLTLIDLRGNEPLNLAHTTWLDSAIASQQQEEATVESAFFIPPISLMTVAAAPLQDNSIKTPATRALALELARRVINGSKGRLSIDLGNRGLDAGMLDELVGEITESVSKHTSELELASSNRFKSHHHEHYLIPVSLQDEYASDRDVISKFCALCFLRIPGHRDGYQCEHGCEYELCQPCGKFLSRVPSLDEGIDKPLRFVSNSQHCFSFSIQNASIDCKDLKVRTDGCDSSGKSVTFATIDGETVLFSFSGKAVTMTIDAAPVLSDVWDVYVESDGTMIVVGEIDLNRRVQIDIMPATSECTLLSQAKQVQALLLFAIKHIFAEAQCDNDFCSSVHKLIWYPKEFRLDVTLAGIGSNDIIRIGISSSLVAQGLISSLYAQAVAAQVALCFGPEGRFPDVVHNDILCRQARSPLCTSCDKFTSPSNEEEFLCIECEDSYEITSKVPTCWHCEDCDYAICNDCWPVQDSCSRIVFDSRFMSHQAYLEGRAFIDSFQSLILEAREVLSFGDPNAWFAPTIRALRLICTLQDAEINDAFVDMLPPFATAYDGVLRLHGNTKLLEAPSVPQAVIESLHDCGGAGAIRFLSTSLSSESSQTGSIEQLRGRPESMIWISAMSRILEICEKPPDQGLHCEIESPHVHTGEWRGAEMAQWCSLADHPEGIFLCTHEGGVLAKPHWSCCGLTDLHAPCSQDIESDSANASAAQELPVGLLGLNGFVHPGCAALRPDAQGPYTCERCEGSFQKCYGAYGVRTRDGTWRHARINEPANLDEYPESPNLQWCSQRCEDGTRMSLDEVPPDTFGSAASSGGDVFPLSSSNSDGAKTNSRSQYAPVTERVNDEGAPMAMSSTLSTTKYYCGRKLGVNRIPGSDGHCGPNNGPQCPSCQRWAPSNSSHGAGSPRWSRYQLRCEVVPMCGLPVYRSPELTLDEMELCSSSSSSTSSTSSTSSSSSSSSAPNLCAHLPWGVFPLDTLEAVLVYKSGGGWLKLHPHAVDRLRELKPLKSTPNAHVTPIVPSHDNRNDSGDGSAWWVPLMYQGRSAFVRLAGPAAVVSAAAAPSSSMANPFVNVDGAPLRGSPLVGGFSCGRPLAAAATKAIPMKKRGGQSTSESSRSRSQSSNSAVVPAGPSTIMAAMMSAETSEEDDEESKEEVRAAEHGSKSTACCKPGGQCISCITYRPPQNRAGLIVYPGCDYVVLLTFNPRV